MKENSKNDIKNYVLFGVVLTILIIIYIVLLLVNHNIVEKYDNMILPNFYVDDYEMSNYNYSDAYDVLSSYEDEILSRRVTLLVNSNEYSFSLKELGLRVDYDGIFDNIKKYQKDLSFSRKLWYINDKDDKETFKIVYYLDDNISSSTLNNLKNNTYVEPISGYFDISDGVRYVEGVNGYSLNVNDSKKFILKFLNENMDEKIGLPGESVAANSNESYKLINTMTSSFVTTFDWIPARVQNLRSAVNYINGAIIEPGEIFSYHRYAGPYDKAGYVFYYKYVGNGVCQVATTVYDAALLGGLEIVKRYPHDKKSEYVAGGLDATVADYGSWNVDMQWKNTYDYPIYLKAYIYGNEIHVEFWSNSEAKKGYEYSTESQWLGGRGYRTFLHTYKDGAEISRNEIDTTWYIKD